MVAVAPSPNVANFSVATPSRPDDAPIAFELDDGSAETSVGFGSTANNTEAAAIWLNRFTPPAGAYPIHLSSISIYWPSQGTNDPTFLTETARLLVYFDADGDGNPSNAVLVGG